MSTQRLYLEIPEASFGVIHFEKDNQKIYVGWTLNVYKKRVNIFDRNKCQATWRDGETLHIKEGGINLQKSPTYIVCN
ncbi:MAG: hypothetical protein AAB257_08235 [Nitrospinota bacterium]